MNEGYTSQVSKIWCRQIWSYPDQGRQKNPIRKGIQAEIPVCAKAGW